MIDEWRAMIQNRSHEMLVGRLHSFGILSFSLRKALPACQAQR